MTAAAERLLEEAMGLSPVDRATIIERLFQSFDPHADRRVDAKWATEIESRIAAYDQGKIQAFPAAEVLART